jgi:preprotein translocase subunit SecD
MPRRFASCIRILVFAAALWPTLSCAPHRSAGNRPSGADGRLGAGLQNGIYSVLREAGTPDSARVGAPGSVVLTYDRKYTDAETTTPPTYVALDTTVCVPLILSAPPDARKDGRGWTMLSVTLAKDQVKPLEDFTRAHLGGRVAIVLDGEIISEHKVRAVIEHGQLQITRCGDNACDVLRAKLAR